MLRRRHLGPLSAIGLSAVLVACGARSSLRADDEDPSGGASAVGGAPGVGGQPVGGSGPGGGLPCGDLALEGEPYTIPANQNATAPTVGLTGYGTLFVAWLAQDGALVGDGSLNAPLPWPDPFDAITTLAPSAVAFTTGPRSGGAIGFYRSAASTWFLHRDPWGREPAEPIFTGDGVPLTVAATDDFAVIGWEEPGVVNLATVEQGLVLPFASLCLLDRPPLDAISRGADILTATADSPSGSSCSAEGVRISVLLA
jgi:hypothetical protein